LLQDKEYERVGGRTTIEADVRVVCATHRDLEAEVRAARFREDLYYRVRVVEIRVPTLAERGPDEILTLARHFADLYARKYDRPTSQFGEETRRMLKSHAWPGNVRELEHWIESAVVLSRDGHLRGDHLAQPSPRSAPPADARDADGALAVPLGLTLEEVTRRYIAATVDACDGNRTEAAKRLEIGRNTITRKLDD
jgi:Nif-specific regulatory protein